MRIDLFGWLRSRIRAAVIGGIADAIASLEANETDEAEVIEAVRLRLAITAAPDGGDQAEADKPRRRKAAAE